MNTIRQRLSALRQAMKSQGFDAWIIPSADPHLSEYLPRHWQARRWMSGFTGSVGTLVVTRDDAQLWADSRYWVQAEAELADTGISLQKLGQGRTHVDDLAERLHAGAVVGVAPDMLSLSAHRQLLAALGARDILLRADGDLLAAIWAERPPLPAEPVVVHDAAFVDESAAQKLQRVREAMAEKKADHHLLSSLDDIAWLTNLRGSDVSYNPVFLAHLLVSAQHATLFVDGSRLGEPARQALQDAGIRLADYDTVVAALGRLQGSLLIDPARVAVSTLHALMPPMTAPRGQGVAGANTTGHPVAPAPESRLTRHSDVDSSARQGPPALWHASRNAASHADLRFIEAINPSTLFKSCKSDADIAHVREAMIEDGVALCEFFAEFEERLEKGDTLTELDIDRMLLEHRGRRPNFVSASFPTIAGFNANGALPHYRATPAAHSEIRGDGMLLIDSGAQYLNGTTDITRVVPVGNPSLEHKKDFTRVLKAHISMAETVFPENIAAPLLDAICRKPMWAELCDYGHGTGHGVGYFLNVHEGPQVLSYNAPVLPQSQMKVGMITSIEPGIYRPGKWGVRIENLVVNQPVRSAGKSAADHAGVEARDPDSSKPGSAPARSAAEADETGMFGKFLRFEALTLCPIDTRLMHTDMMTASEIRWVNDYHALVRNTLAPRVQGAALAWLQRRTEAI